MVEEMTILIWMNTRNSREQKEKDARWGEVPRKVIISSTGWSG